jgi:hypothetical protein
MRQVLWVLASGPDEVDSGSSGGSYELRRNK